MAFGATALHITGMTALLTQKNPRDLDPGGTIVLVVVITTISLLFVKWQLSMREYAKNSYYSAHATFW